MIMHMEKQRFFLLWMALLIFSPFIFSQSSIHHKVTSKIPVIFDTDLGNDIDDVLALQMLLNYERNGKIDLLGITISKANPAVIEYIDAYCRFNKRDNIRLGYVYKGATPEDGKFLRQTLAATYNGNKIMSPRQSYGDSLPAAYILLRKLLASQKDHSVILIAVGPETNIYRLLASVPDKYSSLSGVELVRKKVKLLSVMGGLYNNEFDFPEWNIIQDLEASQYVFKHCPVPLVASGWELGNKLLYPHESILHDFGIPEQNPLAVSYQLYEKMPYDRQTWDLTSVLYAIEPDEHHFSLSPKGSILIDPKGKSIFVRNKSGKQRFLSIGKEHIAATLNVLVQRVTDKPNTGK
jgi:inosine-uridine nucleoside N-ribohydrolase